MVCKEEIELRHVKHSAFKDMILASAITFPREKVLSIFVFVNRKFNIIEIQSNEASIYHFTFSVPSALNA